MEKPYEDLLGVLSAYVDHVYFQPPETAKLKYPCAIVSLSDMHQVRSDNGTYLINTEYDVMIISRDSTNTIAHELLENLKYCRFDRRFISDNLTHDVINVYWC